MQPIATTATTTSGDFDAAHARRVLVRGVVTAVVGCALVLAAVLLLVNQADWWRGYAAATVAGALAAGLSLIPLLRALNKGFTGMVPAVMAATGIRTLVAIGGCVLAVLAGKYPAMPTLILVMPYYMTLLAVETSSLVKLGGGKGNK